MLARQRWGNPALAHPGGKTTLTMAAEIGGMGFILELFGRLMLGSFKKAIISDLEAMASYIEGSKKA